MRFLRKKVFPCVGLLLVSRLALGQMNSGDNEVVYSTDGTSMVQDTNRLFVIHDISITGNNKTKPAIILRELPFKVNEQYPLSLIVQQFKKARKQLMNTGLFHEVIVSLKNLDGYGVDVNVEVQEKWYIWPKAFLKPVDKNFGEWWHESDRSMDRINYGISLSHNNFTGHNDKLRISLMNGYTRQISLQYYGLWLDNELKWSTSGGVSYGQNREVNYMTLRNKQVPIKSNGEFLHSNTGGFFQVNYRPAIKTIHTFGVGYTYENIADTVLKLNPSFSSSANTIQYPELFYKLSYFDVDYIPYPTRGFMGEASLKRKGLGMKSSVNLWELTAKASQTWPLSSKSFFNLRATGMVKLPFAQPYTGKQFIGYEGKYIQGYEYYVIDGVAGGYAKATVAHLIFNTHISIPSQRFKCLNNIPIKMYAKTFVNTGYIYNTSVGENKLTNTFLYSGGIGLDLISFNDFVIKIEWSFNRLGENGLYLHQRNDF